MNIQQRASKLINLDQYNKLNIIDNVKDMELRCPIKRQYILRMLIYDSEENTFKIPNELKWLHKFIYHCVKYQKNVIKINHPYCYITIRHGVVESTTDDQWHVDGFSMRFSHIPEQNYIWCSNNPTEYINQKIKIPIGFDPLIYNIHLLFQDIISKSNFEIKNIERNKIYCIDPYIIHRRPVVQPNTQRTFIRLTFSPIPILDCNNTINPLLPQSYKRDGVKEFRNKLLRYKIF